MRKDYAIVLVSLFFVLTAVSVLAEPCGFDISSPGTTTLTGNVTCTEQILGGVNIDADDVILDCAGFTIEGINPGVENSTNIGIFTASDDNVTVRNCNIVDFSNGLAAYDSNITIENNNFTDNHWRAAWLQVGGHALIQNNLFEGTVEDNALQTQNQDSLIVQNNIFRNFPTTASGGLFSVADSNVLFEHNVISNGTSLIALQALCLGTCPNNVTFYNNTLSNVSVAFGMQGTNFNISGNSVTDCADDGLFTQIGFFAVKSVYDGFGLGGTTSNLAFTDNTVENCEVGLQASNVTGLTLSSNTFTSVNSPISVENIFGTSTADSLIAGTSGLASAAFSNFNLSKGTANANSTYVSSASKFLAIDSSNQPGLNQSATVTLNGVNCASFSLKKNSGYFTSLAALLVDGGTSEIATQANVGGDCTNSADCTNVACSSSTLTFDVTGFSSHGEGELATVPEWSDLIYVLLLGGLVGLFIIQKKKYG